MLAEGANLLRIGLLPGRAKAPGIDQIAHANVKRAPRLDSHAHSGLQHGQQLGRYGLPLLHRRCVEAAQVGIRLPGGHLPVHPVDGGKQGCAYGNRVGVGRCKKHGAVAGSHGLAVQGMALQGMALQVNGRTLGLEWFRRHLHGSVLVL